MAVSVYILSGYRKFYFCILNITDLKRLIQLIFSLKINHRLTFEINLLRLADQLFNFTSHTD
jgi:hypothetical protein